MEDKFTFTLDGQLIEIDLNDINKNNQINNNYNIQKSALIKEQSQEPSALQGVKDLNSIVENNYSEMSFIRPSVLHNPSFTKTDKKEEEDHFIYRNTGLFRRKPLNKNEQDHLNEMYNKIDNEKRVQLSRDFCTDLIYPTFEQISENLKTRNRESKITLNLTDFEVTFETLFNNKVEFFYSISIKNIFKSPVLVIRAKNNKSSYVFRENLSKINISLISEKQIYQDFISAYKEYMSNV